jgi:basic membrane protein A
VEGSVKISAWATAALAVSATMVIAACGSSTSSAPSAGASSSSASAGSGSSAATTGKFLGCMVTDTGGIDDRSFNASAWAGMQAAAKANSNVTVKYLQSTTQADYVPNINTFISQKCGIIVTVGFLMGDATSAAAKAHASQKFAIVDFSYTPPLPNVNALLFDTAQDGFLGGYLAAGMTKTGKVATFGGQKLPTVTIYMDGFYDGVQYYNQKHGKNVQVIGWNEKTQNGTFTGDFTNQTKGQTTTQTFISEGADIIFPVAGNVGLGAAKAVQQADASAGSQKVNMMWVDVDGCASAAQYCKYFITSVQKGIVTAVKDAVLGAAGGAFKGGNYVGTLANGGVALAPFHNFDSQVPSALKSELQQVSTAIQNGSIKVATKSPA